MQPDGHELAWSNRRILAERGHWPEDALEACEQVERDHPGWSPMWLDACEWNGRPAGYYASRYDRVGEQVYGPDPEALAAAIEAAPDRTGVRPFTPLPRSGD